MYESAIGKVKKYNWRKCKLAYTPLFNRRERRNKEKKEVLPLKISLASVDEEGCRRN